MGGGDGRGVIVMARYTSAYSSLVLNLDEVAVLRKSAAQLERADPVRSSKQIDALCRGAIVLLSSHLEAFIKELGELLLCRLFDRRVDRALLDDKFFYHVSKGLIDDIKSNTNPKKISRAIFKFLHEDQDFWCKSDALPRTINADGFNRGFSNPKFDKIKSYLSRFGYHEYHGDLQKKLTKNFSGYKNMVDHVVDIRNLIAHGDTRAKRTPSDVKDMTDIVIQFCRATDDVFATWSKKMYCSIR